MIRAAGVAVLLLSAALLGTGCKHLIRVPGGGDLRIGQESKPVGPIITDETRSGAACGPGLAACPGGTACFAKEGEATCVTEEAACKAAGCGSRPCEIAESFPMKAICH
ncbi:MAG: hypothetical protein Q8R92_09780 [Deltaproteobacteria bacterium]|nr:hypothetical protein [Deltaproteobacteria bacterium]